MYIYKPLQETGHSLTLSSPFHYFHKYRAPIPPLPCPFPPHSLALPFHPPPHNPLSPSLSLPTPPFPTPSIHKKPPHFAKCKS